MWGKPNEFYSILRCTSNKYAKKLFDSGSIKFNTPKAWVEEEKKNGKGRGDMFEGVFAACSPFDIENVIKYSRRYDDVYGETIEGLTYFRSKRTMNLPCYCFFLLKQDLFECPDKEGTHKISADIPASYFQNFADNKTREEINQLKAQERPAVVVISDMEKFLYMIKKKLLSLGLHESEIMVEVVEYADIKTPFYCTGGAPKELKIKDKFFSYQAEGRIIVNTDKYSIIEYLNNNPIEIGSISDFSKTIEGYLDQGIIVEMTANIYKLKE